MKSQEQTKINPWLTTVYRWFSRLSYIYIGIIFSLSLIRTILEMYSDFTGDRSFNDHPFEPYLYSALFLFFLNKAINLTIERKVRTIYRNKKEILYYFLSIVFLLFFITRIS
jgi:hypothetical protein